jgi:hypothetical protein
MPDQTIRFAEVKHIAIKSVPCEVCGKKVRRQQTFWQTLNPFNKNASGFPKDASEIRAELRVVAAEWEQQPERHARCEVQS